MSRPRMGSPVGVIAACVSALLLGLTPTAQPPQESPPFVPGEVLVQYRTGVAEHRRAGARTGARARLLRRFAAIDAEQLRLEAGADPRVMARLLRADPNVRAAQPNYLRRIHAPAPPNDFFWLSNGLWGMQRINAQPAWVTFGGGPHTVVIANIDTGVNYNHPDLAANMWRNPREIPGNGIDDDGNGYIDDVYGIDTVNGDSDPFDDHGHGTHTAGTAAAVANNEIGVAGVAWNARILACKFIDANGVGPDAAAVACFNYVMALKAQGVNVRVTSNSWGHRRLGEPAAVLRNAIDAAGQAGILNVFAAGNARTNNDVEPFDPASFTSPSIIAVAASGEVDDANEGNYGPRTVHLAAPGADILSTYRAGYQRLTGTSSSTAHVAGGAALLFSHHPALTVREARDALLDSVDRVPRWQGAVVSGGILDVYRALAHRGTNMLPTVALTSPPDGMTLTSPATIRLAASALDRDGVVTMVDFHANGTSIARDTTPPFEWTWNGVPPGTYRFTAVATDNAGATASSPPVSVTVREAAHGPTPFYGAPTRLPGIVQAEDFDHGGQQIAYFDRTPGNAGGAYRATDVDIAPADDTGGGYTLGWVSAGEWLRYTVEVGAAGLYDIEVRVASAGAGGTFHIEENGVNLTGAMTIPDTGDWQAWRTIRRTGVRLRGGVQVWRIVMDANGASGAVGNINYIRVVAAATTTGSTAFHGTPVRLPGLLQAEDFDHGGQQIAYFDRTPGNAGGVYRATDVDIAPAEDTGGGYTLGWVSAGEWLHYTVEVGAAGLYDIEVRVASAGAGGTFHIEESGVNLTGPLGVPDTGGWQAWRTIRRTGVNLRSGVQVWRLVMDTNGVTSAVGNINHIRVIAPAAAGSTPFHGTPVRLPGLLQAEDFDHGGQQIAYYDRTPGNAGGAYRATDVDIASAEDMGSGYTLGWVSAGEWLHYTVEVGAAGLYDIEVRVASAGAGGTFHIEEGGVDLTGPLTVPDTGGWQSWRTIRRSNVSLRRGVQVWRLVMDANGVTSAVGNINYIRVLPAN